MLLIMLEINPEPIFATRLYKPDRAGTADTAYSLLSLCQGHADMDACLLPPPKKKHLSSLLYSALDAWSLKGLIPFPF